MPFAGVVVKLARIAFCLALLAGLPVPASLAEGVYVKQGENGPIFSDKPMPGAKEIQLKPLNSLPSVPAETVREAWPANGKTSDRADESSAGKALEKPAADPATSEAAGPADADAVPYDRFQIVYPERYGAVLANTAVFEVRLAVEPPLRLGAQHAFIVSINGRPVNQRYTATEFMIPPDYWTELPPPNQMMQLDATIIDGKGQVLKRAEPVRFYLRYASVRPMLPVPAVRLPPAEPRPPKSKERLPGESAPGGSAVLYGR